MTTPHKRQKTQENAQLGTSPRAIWRLTWPQVLIMYLMFLMGFVAVWVAGRISADAQAALGMVNQCSTFLMVVAMALSSGAMSCVSQSLGARRPGRAKRYVAATVAGCFVLGLLVAAIGWFRGEAILVFLRVPDAIFAPCLKMWRASMLCLPAQYLYAGTGMMFRATRQVVQELVVTAAVCVISLVLCLGLGLGWFGFPDFGYMGLIWAIMGSTCVGAFCNCWLLSRSGYLARNALPRLRWLRAGLPYLLKVALPAGAAQLVWHSGYLTLFVLVASLPRDSVNALAGLTAGLRVEALLFMPAMACNMSVAVLVGNLLGAGQPTRAKKVGLNMVWVAAIVMSVLAACIWPFRETLAGLLSEDLGAQAQIVNYLNYNLVSTPFSVASTVMGGIMVGAGATRYNLFIYGGTFWLVRLPLGWLLGCLVLGTAEGVFCAMLVSQVVQTLLMLRVARGGKWTRFAMRHESRI